MFTPPPPPKMIPMPKVKKPKNVSEKDIIRRASDVCYAHKCMVQFNSIDELKDVIKAGGKTSLILDANIDYIMKGYSKKEKRPEMTTHSSMSNVDVKQIIMGQMGQKWHNRGEPEGKAPTERPPSDDYLYFKPPDNKNQKTNSVSFDQLIMECDDLLDIETKVKTTYAGWLKDKTGKLKTNINFDDTVKFKIKYVKSRFKTNILLSLLVFSGIPFFYFSHWPYVFWSSLPLLLLSCVISISFFKIDKIKQEKKVVGESQTNLSTRTEDELKLIFLKESYVGTIQNLNDKLDIIQERIQNQRMKHIKQKETILSLKNMYSNTDEIIKKLDIAIKSMDNSYEKISKKKGDINITLNEYIGENGYINQKEKEIQQLKLAQELSSQMEKDFNETLEITKSVDVLTETIIPGIKQLMSFRIPELIDDVNFQCDKEKVYLDMKS